MKNKGFTLIELLTSISIIVLLSTLLLANYRAGEKQFALKRSAYKLAQDLRSIEQMTMTGKEFEGVFPKGGYGIHFKEGLNSYTVFADCNNNEEFDELGFAANCLSATEEDVYPEEVETLFLEEGVIVSELSPHTGGKTLEVRFLPPDPILTINPSSTLAKIKITSGEKSKTINIYSTGLIDIE